MPVSTPNAQSIMPSTQSSGGSLKLNANKFRYDSQADPSALWASAAESFSNAQSQIDNITGFLRQPLPAPQLIQILDPSGNLIAEIGNMTGTNNQAYQGLWGKNLYVGGSGPDTAPVFVDSRGSGAQVFVVDQFGNIGAWLGNQTELPLTISNVTDCSTSPYTGNVQITITAHGYVNGDNVNIVGVTGVPNANIGMGIIHVLDANNFVLLQTPFSGSYTGGGTSTRFYSGGMFSALAVGGSQVITNIQNNGGLIQITVPNHGYSSGYAVIVTDTTGIPNLNYLSWNVTVIDANNFTLNGSVFSGVYDGLGGQCLNWPTAKLRAYDDGSVDITNASITIDSNGITTIIANAPVSGIPSTPAASIVSIDNATGAQSYLDPFALVMQNANGNYTVNLSQTTTGATLALTEASGLPFHFSEVSLVATTSETEVYLFHSTTSSNGQTAVLGYGTLEFTQTASGGNDSVYGLAGVTITNGSDVTTITQSTISITNGGSTVTIGPTSVNSPAYSAGGVPGIGATFNVGTSLSVGTSSTGVFGTPGTGQSNGTVITSITLNVSSHTWTEGLLTA